jgi:hypothetical protein
MGMMKNVYKVLNGKPEGKKTFGRPRHRWEDNIGMDLRKIRVGRCGLYASGSG